jgi:hypothetical protein
MIVSGLIRARYPRSESDSSFLLTSCALLAVALLPPPALDQTGPLCQATTLLGAGERIVRAMLFGGVYAVFVYAAAPPTGQTHEVLISVARAASASLWILVASSWALPVAPLQAALVMFSRLRSESHLAPCPQPYESVPLQGAQTPVDARSDIENADEDSALATKLALSRAAGNGALGVGLSFNFGGNGHSTNSMSTASIAAIAAREAGGAV